MRRERKATRVCKRRLIHRFFATLAGLSLSVLCLAQGPPTYYITTVAGTGGSSGFSGDGGPATQAQLASPTGVAVDGAGTLYIADQVNNRIREVTKGGLISTQAGSSASGGFAGDGGAATSADLNAPLGVVVDSSGNFYIADTKNDLVRKVTAADVISTYAGQYALGFAFTGDGGVATSAAFNGPAAVAMDKAGNLYVVDIGNNRIRKVTASTGIITTIAGTNGQGFSGDGGLATIARLSRPLGVAVDSSGTVYIADSQNNRIRKVVGSTITTIVGTGAPAFSGDGGPAVNAALNNPSGVAVDAAGNLYIADTNNGRIRVVINGTIYTIAGSGRLGQYGGDGGLATSAPLNFPYGLTVDSQGNIFVADTQNHVIRELTGSLVSITPPPVITPGGVISASQFGAFPSTTPGSWIEIYGSTLASNTRSWATSDFTKDANNNAIAPTSLDKTSVSIGGKAAFIDFISFGQVNALVPSNVAPGPQQLTVTTAGGTTLGYVITVYPNQPEMYAPPAFNINGNQYVAAVLSDGTTHVLPPGTIPGVVSRQAKPGETITIYGIGFGPVTPTINAGQIVQQTNAITTPLLLLFGNTPAVTTYAGLAPGLVGLYQINVVVPSSVANNDLVPLSFTLGGSAGSQILYTAVHN
jgi:uncharacterized protein (TIGR03437 family)